MARAGRFVVDATKFTSGARAPVAKQPGNKQGAEPGRQRSDSTKGSCNVTRHADANPCQTQNPHRKRRRRRRGRRSQRKKHNNLPSYGALDLGTNNCRLLVAQPSHNGFKVIDAFSRIVRLGEGVSKSGRLSEEAMDRCIGALRVCASKLKWRGVKRSRLIATEACRVTENGPEFIARVAEETGLELEIIDRETEARLAFAGSASLIAPKCEHALVFDIGGGSTELMWVRCVDGAQELIEWDSLPAGVVTIAEGYGGVEVTPDSYAKMKGHALDLLNEFSDRVAGQVGAHATPDHLLGTSGTVTTIAGVHLGLKRYDRSKVDGCWMSHDDVSVVTDGLLQMSYEQRAASPCIGRERADLVLAGCAIFDAIRERWPAPHVRVADRGLREGILTTLMREDGTYANPPKYQRPRKR